MLREREHHGPTSLVWLWPGAAGAPPGPPSAWPPSHAVLTLEWAPDEHAAWVHGFLGRVTRGNLRELLTLCETKGVRTLKAHRREGRRLPGAVPVGDHYEIDLTALRSRVG